MSDITHPYLRKKKTDEFVYGEQRNEIAGIINYLFMINLCSLEILDLLNFYSMKSHKFFEKRNPDYCLNLQ